MAHTDKLLSLVDQFPQAFSDAQETPASFKEGEAQPEVASRGQNSEQSNDRTTSQQIAAPNNSEPLQAHFLSLMQEFPQAFTDPSEAVPTSSQSGTNEPSDSQTDTSSSLSESATSAPEEISQATGSTSSTNREDTQTPPAPSLPPGDYDQALQRKVSTFTWGEVQIFLAYNQEGLRSIWVTVGKSGTEVQSLCEAISRLINLLLEKQVPIPEICRQIRGIRGADSEGLGPNRILGLADLVGKVLHEAPEQLTPAGTVEPSKIEVQTSGISTHKPITASTSTDESNSSTQPSTTLRQEALSTTTPQTAEGWSIPEVGTLTAMLCPECSAELHHMNGCSGGACPVCGYSSCS